MGLYLQRGRAPLEITNRVDNIYKMVRKQTGELGGNGYVGVAIEFTMQYGAVRTAKQLRARYMYSLL